MQPSMIPRLCVLSLFLVHAFSNAETTTAPTPPPHEWRLPDHVPYPDGNEPTPQRVELGRMLYFDKRLSRDGTTSCASCHDPAQGWSDGLATSRGLDGKTLPRASPTIINAAYNTIQMWDGRKASLEDQAMGPMDSPDEMATDFDKLMALLGRDATYRAAFQAAYPDAPIDKLLIAKAIASFERTVVARNAPFDRWLAGDVTAMTVQQQRGFQIFVDPNTGNCAVCHRAPLFTDNGFHNIGLSSFGREGADPGRFAHKPIAVLKGAFKTPTLRNIAETAPYFHDGSAATLMDVVEHYARGGDVKTNLSPNLKTGPLTQQDKDDLVAFMQALSSPIPAPIAAASTRVSHLPVAGK